MSSALCVPPRSEHGQRRENLLAMHSDLGDHPDATLLLSEFTFRVPGIASSRRSSAERPAHGRTVPALLRATVNLRSF